MQVELQVKILFKINLGKNWSWIRAQGLVTIHVNILSMHKHVQCRTPFFTPARFKSCLFFKFLLIYSKPHLGQLPRPYSFQKDIMTSPRLPLKKAQRSFLSGIRFLFWFLSWFINKHSCPKLAALIIQYYLNCRQTFRW